MKSKLFKKLIAGTATLAMVTQLGFALPASAEGEYYTLDFEQETARGTDNNKTGDKQDDSLTLQDGNKWDSKFGAGGMSIAKAANAGINMYYKYEIGSTSGQRASFCDFGTNAKQVDENKRAVFEMDFYMSAGGAGNQIVLAPSYDRGKTNLAYTGDYALALYQKDKDTIAVNTLDGTDAITVTTGYTSGTWAHIKSVMNFAEDTTVVKITSLDGQTTYLEETKLAMQGDNDNAGFLVISEPRNISANCGVDNIVFRPYADGDIEGVYYMATITVDGKTVTRTADKTTGLISDLPDTTKTGYIFDGWAKDGDTDSLMTNEQVLTTALTADVTYEAVYHKNPDYIEPMVALEFLSFPDNNKPVAGADENTAESNPIQVKIIGELGGNLGGDDFDSRVDDLDVKWEFKGFRHIASKAEKGEPAATTDDVNSNEYCDSYAEVVYDDADPTKVDFRLKSQAFNFYGEVVATVTYAGKTMTIKKPMAILPTNTTDGNTLLPKQGYVTNFDWYSDDMAGYQATTSGDNKSAIDVVTGDWAAYGGNSGRGLYLAKDEETGKKFLKLKSTGSNSSSFAVNKLDEAPTGQVIIEQDIKFYNSNSSLLFKQDNPVTWSANATSFSVNFNGTALDINGSKIADATAGVWYKIVASVDVTSKLCYAKAYDMEGNLLGESDIVPFTNEGATAPVYLCYRTPDNSTGELDFNNVKMYIPEIDGELTTTISNDTLVIPTDLVLKDGINYDSSNKKIIVKKDLPDETKATLIAVSYRGDKLAKITESTLTFKDGQASADAEVSGTTKFMVWDSLEGMMPVCDSKTVEGTSEVANTATLTVDAKSTEGYNIISNAEWTVVDDATGEASEFVTITPDESNSHNATLTVAKGASGGTYNVTVSLGGKSKTIPVTVTGTQDSVKFTKSISSIGIPLEEGASQTYEYSAIAVDSDNNNLNKPVTYAMYDKNNVNPLANTEAISFDAETGVLTVTSAAEGTVVYIRAMSTNSEDKPITRSLKVTIHGLAFDLGSASEVVEGYTAVSPSTAYNEQTGYGIEGAPTIGGTGSFDDPDSDNLAGNFTFKAKVPAGKVYKVTVKYTGNASAEKYNADLTGVDLKSDQIQKDGESILIPVIDDVLDITFSGGNVSSIVIEKTSDKVANLKPHIYTVGDSTIANNGSWAYVLSRDYANYTDLSALASFSNNGRGGKNLGSYYTGGEFTGRVLTNICPGDYVMIGDMGTNGMGSKFEESFNYYIDACEALGAKVILNSYSPHGAVGDYAGCYDSSTHTFTGYRQDEYDKIVRKIYEERTTADGEKYDENIVGFVDIGKMADAAFNAYVANYAANDYADENTAAQAIISCFGDHNHYSNGSLAAKLMIEGYGAGADAKGIVKSLVEIISADLSVTE
ncbi:MAG: hypothetical protein ACI4C7_09665 [Clostridia bacterium]